MLRPPAIASGGKLRKFSQRVRLHERSHLLKVVVVFRPDRSITPCVILPSTSMIAAKSLSLGPSPVSFCWGCHAGSANQAVREYVATEGDPGCVPREPR
jgi:hypothetical protein